MFSGQVHNLSRCASWEDADALFKNPRPRGTKWGENEQPLGTSRAYHYRVERSYDDSYKVYLYNTCMARYEKPVGNERHVEYSWDNRTTSTSFMYYVVRVQATKEYATTDGHRVEVPMTSGGVSLHFVDGRLDTARSAHPTQYKYVASARDKEKRAELRKELQTLVSLAAIRYKDAPLQTDPGAWNARRQFMPFKGPQIAYATQRAVADEPLDSPEFIDAFLEGAEDVCNFSKGRANYNDRPAPSIPVLETALLNWVLKLRRANGKNERVALPLFPEVK